MRKLLVLAFAVAVLAGCKSVPFFSTSYGEAHPYNSFDNDDGSTTIEFKFILDRFDAKEAMQRIDEFLTKYSGEKGFTGYNVENVDGRPIDADEGSSWVAPAGASWVKSPANVDNQMGKEQYVHIR